MLEGTEPTNLVLVGECRTEGIAAGVTVSSNHAYVACSEAGLEVIDVTNPAAPFRVGRYDTDGSAYGVAVAGNYAYVADGGAGLQIIDIGDPAKPVLVASHDTDGSARSLAMVDNHVYVADDAWGLQIFRIDIFASPAPTWSEPELTRSGFQAWLNPGTPGVYRVEWSDNLTNWNLLFTTNLAERLRVIDPNTADVGIRFYRAVLE